MKYPNFFIIGAPKCGTTSMANFLGAHPQIFLSNPKEIHFFNTDHKIGDVHSLEKYLSIFSGVREEHLAVGEASTFYLYSKVAVKNIIDFNPSAKFIVMLRNPLTMVTSFHAEMCWSGLENEADFEKAWLVSRSKELSCRNVGYACNEPLLLKYEDVCKLGEQVGKLLQIVDKKNVLFVIQDDIVKNSVRECQRVLDFLGVGSDVERRMECVNASKRPRSALFRKVIWFFGRIRRWCRVPQSIEIFTKIIHNLNSRNYNHQAIRPELKSQLIEVFRADVNLLSSLLARDFSFWIKD